MSKLAFSNVRILDFTHYLAGPVGTFQLAMQGADVIKIEPLAGDGMRPSATEQKWVERNMGPAWMAANAGKRSIKVDLSKPEGVEIIKRLAATADVVCENFRPGVMERLGVGWSQLSALNPRLIYCAVSGFGTTGPDSKEPAFDGKIQAMSGLMALTGEPEQGPMRAGFAAADVATGMMTAFALSTALYQRTHTGVGQFVDVSMLDTMLNFLACQAVETTVSNVTHVQNGNRSISRKPTADRFRCGDRFIVLAVMTDKQFVNLLTALGRADALADQRFADWAGRTEHREVLREIIESAMATGGADHWEARLKAADIPFGRVHSLEEIIRHRQVEHRGVLQEAATPYGPVTLIGPAFRMAHDEGHVGPVADLGQHTDEVLREAGYDAQAIAALHASGII